MGNQLRVVVHVPNALLDLLLVDNETMKRKDMEERLTVLVLVLVRLIVITIVVSLTHSLTTASSGLPYKSVSVFIIV